ncbi:MAG: HIT family protein [Phycisphaerales bacterium]
MTIFTKIIRGEIPCHKVYQDEHVIAFLDISPLSPGHTLVVPTEEVATLGELSDEAAAAVGRVLPRICRAVCAAVGASDYNVLQNNGRSAHQVVPHVHFHIIPVVGGEQLGIGWKAGKLEGATGAELAKRIAAGIQK